MWVQALVEECEAEGEPVRIMTLLNRVANRFRFESWSAKNAQKKVILRLITKLLHQGRLARVGRKYVTVPASKEKFDAWVRSTLEPLDLPEPQI